MGEGNAKGEHLLNTIVYCVGSNILTIFGIVGNLFALFILYQAKMQNSKSLFYGYLTALAVSDLLYLLGIGNCQNPNSTKTQLN